MNNYRATLSGLVSSLLCLFLFQSASAQEQLTVLQGARLILGDGSVLEQTDLAIQNGAIVSVGNVNAAGAEIIDLRGKTVLPALIDAHAHLGYEAATGWGAENYSRANLIDNLQRYAYYGFAAVFSAGSDPAPVAQALQADFDNGDYLGARMLFAAGMAPPGQGPNNQFLTEALAVENQYDTQILYGLEDAATARATVAQLANDDVHFLKLWVDDRGGTQRKLTPAIYRAVATTADQYDMRVFVHQQNADDMADLINAGVHGFLHGRLGDDFGLPLARQLAEADVFVVPNLGLAELRRQAIGDDAFLQQTMTSVAAAQLGSEVATRQADFTPDASQDAALSQSLAAMLNAGADIVLGTDAGAVPGHPFGYTGHRELEIYVRLGMTPMQALVAGTSNAARHLGLDENGLLAPGYRADLLILDANPLEDIRNTQQIDRVYIGGKIIERSQLRSEWTRIQAQ